MDSDTLPNAIVRAATIGYQHTNDPSSLQPLVERYFASLADLWSSRSYHIAATLIVGLYPAPLASAELRDATRAWLDANPEPVALHRLVVENLAGVERALRCRRATSSHSARYATEEIRATRRFRRHDTPASARIPSVAYALQAQDRVHLVAGELRAAAQVGQLQHHADPADGVIGTLDEACRRGEGAAGGQHVVEDEHARGR